MGHWRNWWMAVWAFWLPLYAAGQNTVRLDSSLALPFDLTSAVSVWIDSTGEVADEQAMTEGKFTPLKTTTIPRLLQKEVHYSYWVRLTLQNATSVPQELLLTLGNFYETTLYERSPTAQTLYQQYTSQRLLPSERLYRYDHRYFPLHFSPHQSRDLYAKIRALTGKPFEIRPFLYSYEAEAKERVKSLYDDYFPMAVNHELMAVLAFLTVFFLFQWVLNRQRYLLLYSFYLMSMWGFAAYGASYSSYVVDYISYVPFLRFTLQQNFYILLTLFTHTFFLFEILGMKNWPSSWTKRYFERLFYVVGGLLAIELVLTVVYRRLDLETNFHQLCQFALPVLNVTSLVLLWVTKERVSWFIKLGALVMVIGTTIGFASVALGWAPMSSMLLTHYPNVYFNYGVLIDILFFSLATGEKMVQVQRERNRLLQNYALSELTTLRTQINPHFLFNSLNSIKSYIIKNKTQEAAAYLTDFSVLMREILDKSREQFLPLGQELEIIRQYLLLEQRRFSQPFQIDIQIDEAIDLDAVQVPAFLLQPFVENAIKHGFKRLEREGCVWVKVSSLEDGIAIIIEDNGIGRDKAAKLRLASVKHRSMGLSLVENRLRLLREIYHWNIDLTIEDVAPSTGTRVTLRIPFFD